MVQISNKRKQAPATFIWQVLTFESGVSLVRLTSVWFGFLAMAFHFLSR